jgi:hypothetical protein
MGAGASSEARGVIRNPFPVSPQTGRDLNKLSYVVNRILSTADIYDINNLAKPGVCGDYAVFLKQQIVTQMLNFNAESEDGSKVVSVAYQNPTKAFAKQEDRQRICQQIAGTMLTVIATVVASLGSIQVSTRPVGLQFQQGGGTEAVRMWLGTYGYIVDADRGKPQGQPMQIRRSQRQQDSGVSLALTLMRSDENISTGFLTASGGGLPVGSLRIYFLDPQSMFDPTKQVLPLRIVDEKGLPWVSGALLSDSTTFKSFGDAAATPFTEMIETLYRRKQTSGTIMPLESREQIAYASAVFDYIRRNPGNAPALISRIVNKVPGISAPAAAPAAAPLAAPAAAPTAVFPSVQPAAAPFPSFQPAPAAAFPSFQPAAAPIPSFAPAPLRPVARAQPGFGQSFFPGLAPAIGAKFDIPYGATAEVLKFIKRAQTAIGAESNPAAVRAYLLAGEEKPNRTVVTAVCNDPYWRASSLANVYPWATFQLLAVKDLTKMGDKTSVKFHDEWATFLSGLQGLYGDANIGISLQLPASGPAFLEGISVKGLADSAICRNRIAGYKQVQDGLLRLQGLYEEHVAEIWEILNSLVILVVDPVTKAEVVKLHPKVVEEGTASRKYVERIADRAREAIGAYYLDVEKAYVSSIRSIVGTTTATI